MLLNGIDWTIIALFFAFSLIIGLIYTKQASKDRASFFLSGRNMPWWLMGTSMVATTFSTDTPNLVTDIVRTNGVAGNWVWWAFLLGGMMTVFIFAKLWRRSGVLTDVEFYELRYSGAPAAFLRGFRAIYLGLFFQILIMAAVTLAAIKIGSVMFNLEPWQTISIAIVVTVFYSTSGGLKGVVVVDFFQFGLAMVGSLYAANFVLGLPGVGGLDGLLSHPNVEGKLNIMPDFSDPNIFVPLFLIPIAVQWWSVFYPGAEPGGGSYIAQRILASKNERHAMGATMLFNVAHYALRPWPWIIVALASLVVFPDLASIKESFPSISGEFLKEDVGYSAMLTMLPNGWLGLIAASLIAAYMSTMSTQLNLGSSYLTNDFYQRFVHPSASERQLVFVGRITTVVLAVLGATFALLLESALGVFNLIINIGAGSGLIFILRWFWWRINAFSEIAAMVVSFVTAITLIILNKNEVLVLEPWQDTVLITGITTAGWLITTLFTRPTDTQKLREFYRLTHPGGPGWRRVREQAAADGETAVADRTGWDVPKGILCSLVGCVAVYGALFSTGYWIYGDTGKAMTGTVITVISAGVLAAMWRGLHVEEGAEKSVVSEAG